MPDLQELLALGIVAVVAALYWRRRHRRAGTGCGDCAGSGSPPAGEQTLRFHRRRPGPGSPDDTSPG